MYIYIYISIHLRSDVRGATTTPASRTSSSWARPGADFRAT